MNGMTAEAKIQKAHVTLMSNPITALMSGIIMMGKSVVLDDNCPTAYTDGIDKYYGREFIDNLPQEEVNFLVGHENGHILLRHVTRFGAQMKEDAELTNASADYVLNDMLVEANKSHKAKSKEGGYITPFMKMPEGGLYDEKYHNWSTNEVLRDLKKQKKEGKNPETNTLDEHRAPTGSSKDEKETPMSQAQRKELDKKIEEVVRQGGMVVGKLGGDIPQVVKEMLQPVINWEEVTMDFVSQTVKGAEEYAWRPFSKRHIANDIYLPSTIKETLGELIVSVDVSGSGAVSLDAFSSELQHICTATNPERVRVLWWDTKVTGEQIFSGNYDNIHSMLKPTGGGGTRPECIIEYLSSENITAEAIIVFTDGLFGKTPDWDTTIPTLWVTTWEEKYLPKNCKVVKADL